MPLHLLPKKSWHVYNAANIERVKRDEAAAREAAEAADQRMQEEDARRRTALLRGEPDPGIAESSGTHERGEGGRRRRGSEGDGLRDSTPSSNPLARKRRRLRGEDETDSQIRFAREDAAFASGVSATLRRGQGEERGGRDGDGNGHGRHGGDAPLMDAESHVQLFPPPIAETTATAADGDEVGEKHRRRPQKSKDSEADSQVGMRFVDAAGRNNKTSRPWYTDSAIPTSSPSTSIQPLTSLPQKDVWGNADPRRRERETQRLTSSDPLAAMKSAQTQLKRSERDRSEWMRERMVAVAREGEEKRRRRGEEKRRRREEDKGRGGRVGDGGVEDEGLDGFRLDAPGPHEVRDRKDRESQEDEKRRRSSHSARRRRSSRSRSRERRGHQSR